MKITSDVAAHGTLTFTLNVRRVLFGLHFTRDRLVAFSLHYNRIAMKFCNSVPLRSILLNKPEIS